MATANRRPWSTSPPAIVESLSRRPPATATASSFYFPPELIPRIASRLTSLQDFFALRAACRAYRALLPLTPSNLASQAPLLVPCDDSESHALLHLPLRRIHRFRLPRTGLGATHDVVTEVRTLGCRVAISQGRSQTCDSSMSALVLNGVTNAIYSVSTASGSASPPPPRVFDRILLSGDIVVSWEYDHTIYCRVGAPKWRTAAISLSYHLEHLILVKDTLYALVDPDQRLATVELPDNSNNNNGLKLTFLGNGFDTQEHGARVFSLAECRGELLLVLISMGSEWFHVLQWQSEERKWVRITNLGGCTLFFAGSYFSGYLGPDHPGIRGDCIYDTRSRFCCVFSLIDKSLDGVATLREEPYCCPPLWVFPSMC
ncbi:unnamed protein product [Urochloa decumbens]|uniref:KIB1-4 beta-propeller domain-containing protein n=1 Tax=Urochloa decumbens TaxID=240449 RepID=A0ABC9C7J1_9POAL